MKFTIPTEVFLPRKTKADKKAILNLNVYRNLDFRVNNQAKQIYKSLVGPMLIARHQEYLDMVSDYEKLNGRPHRAFKLIYTITAPNQRRFDISNVLCICDKFFCDVLVDSGYLPDDNWEYLTEVSFKFGGVTTGMKICEAELLLI